MHRFSLYYQFIWPCHISPFPSIVRRLPHWIERLLFCLGSIEFRGKLMHWYACWCQNTRCMCLSILFCSAPFLVVWPFFLLTQHTNRQWRNFYWLHHAFYCHCIRLVCRMCRIFPEFFNPSPFFSLFSLRSRFLLLGFLLLLLFFLYVSSIVRWHILFGTDCFFLDFQQPLLLFHAQWLPTFSKNHFI